MLNRGDELLECCPIATLESSRQRLLGLRLLLLLFDFEEDLECYRHPERKAGDADYHSNRCFLDAKDISKQVRGSVRDLGLIEEIPGGS